MQTCLELGKAVLKGIVFRPISSALCVLCNCVGVAVSYKINSLFDWRSADYIQSGIVAGVALLSLMLPESHVWLLLKGLLF